MTSIGTVTSTGIDWNKRKTLMTNGVSLPKGAYIPPLKFVGGFTIPSTSWGNLWVAPFSITNGIPFPAETNRPASTGQPYITLPYIAFDDTGRLVSGQPGQPELIPIAEGSVSFPRDPISKVASPAGIGRISMVGTSSTRAPCCWRSESSCA